MFRSEFPGCRKKKTGKWKARGRRATSYPDGVYGPLRTILAEEREIVARRFHGIGSRLQKNVTELFYASLNACHFLNKSVKQGPRNSRKEREMRCTSAKGHNASGEDRKGEKLGPKFSFLSPRTRRVMASSSSSSLSPEYLQLPVFSAINMGGRARRWVSPLLSLRRGGGDRERRKEEEEEL